MAAPSSLLIAKLIMPETEKVDNNVELSTEREDANVIDATARGASEGMQLVINVAKNVNGFHRINRFIKWIIRMGWFSVRY